MKRRYTIHLFLFDLESLKMVYMFDKYYQNDVNRMATKTNENQLNLIFCVKMSPLNFLY